MRKVLEHCPTCGGELEITRLNCRSCETVVLGRYQPCPFCQLSPESVKFLESFIKSRGNVKEMERESGISYWTIRRKLDTLIEELGFEVTPLPDSEPSAEKPSADFKTIQLDILEQVNRGIITAAEAAARLAQFDPTRR